MEKLTYVRFLPSGHYGSAELTISDEKCEPYSYKKILKAYKGASCTSWAMGDAKKSQLESVYEEYGDFGCFNSVYVFSKNSPELEREIYGLMEGDFNAHSWEQNTEKYDYDDYLGYIFSKDLSDNYLFSYGWNVSAYTQDLEEMSCGKDLDIIDMLVNVIKKTGNKKIINNLARNTPIMYEKIGSILGKGAKEMGDLGNLGF